MTLIELSTTILVLGILSTIVVSLFVNISTNFTRDRAATDSTNIAAIGMNEITRVIRAGTEIRVANVTLNDPVFVTANREEMTIYSYLADSSTGVLSPVKVQLAVNATSRELRETRWSSTKNSAGYWIFSTTPGATRTIARLIPPITPPLTAGQKYLFTYYDSRGVELTMPASGGLTESQRRAVAAVQVTVTVQADLSARAKAFTLQNTVGMPNLGVSRVGP
ncbi:type II secretory pathway pseudopilin PulG [Conyzicola lurida]|uniref:Type II secretory pathway pseudopilin PulG n=1 Tax=Conyzicola lurida TaxID=1172621 RepID=A0A841AK10_9MICO|nr:type II secretion system protein [Conyzicola lurida]MBB5841805.1 type II secretory pathway pseudopilin PulG [Conyzicola lurida]